MTRRGHPRSRALAVACAIAAPLVLIAQSGRPGPAAQTGPAATAVTFTDVTAAAGIKFRHSSGAFGRKYLPETMGSGVAFLDIDADGWQDVFFVNATRFPGRPDAASYPALYRNNGNGTFTDVTRAAGLFVEMYGMGAAAADYDNDGRTDLYVTALGANRLFRNAGGSRFVDVTTRAGVGDPGFSTSAAWLDYNRDGVLDLFVANYVEWSPQKDLFCTLDGTLKSYCTPESYQGHSSTLYRGKGDGTFEDVTRPAGIYDPNGKALGVALIDYDSDGWMDLFVAHDTQPNRLYRNLRNGRFTDVGLMAGVAFSEAGAARAGMGVDAADYDGSGRQGLIVGNFSNEMMALYANEGTGLFIDEAPASAVGKASLLTLTFGAFFFDYDLDGRIDIFAANGHVADDIGRVQPNVKYAQPPHLFRNTGARKFEAVTGSAGTDFGRPIVGRGAAYADYDGDGDLDVIVTTNNGPARLLRNDGGNRNRWIRVAVVGTRSNRNGIGTKVQAIIGDAPGPWAYVKTGSSYCSQSELPVTLGLERAQRVSLRVTWPDGQVETIGPLETNRTVTVTEGRGMTGTR